MLRRNAIIAIAVLAVLAIVLSVWRYGGGPDPEPALTGGTIGDPSDAEKPEFVVTPAVATSNVLPHDMRLKPGEVVPGTRPGTIIVQPMQPGPPKEIYDSYIVPTAAEDPRIDRLADGRLLFHEPIAMAGQLHKKGADPYNDVGILEGILGYYRLMYRENPVAESNISIIEALTGKNQHNMVVFPDDHPDLNAQGQLLDRWGTPYFFHALSSTQMDILSAGADRKRGTLDDIKLGETDESLQLNRGETDPDDGSDG
jgi:hypothetical protein